MIRDRKNAYNRKSRGDAAYARVEVGQPSPEPFQLRSDPKLANLQRKHRVTERMKALSSSVLASRVGYLNISPFSHHRITDELPRQSYQPGEVIPCDECVYWIRHGLVLIRHSRHKYQVKRLDGGSLFGELPILGQTMLVTEAIAGAGGVSVWMMTENAAREWIASEPGVALDLIIPRIGGLASSHFRSKFQRHDSEVAALLLQLAKGQDTIRGITQEGLAETIGIYRETVNDVLRELRSLGFIEIRRMAIKILDYAALKILSDL